MPNATALLRSFFLAGLCATLGNLGCAKKAKSPLDGSSSGSGSGSSCVKDASTSPASAIALSTQASGMVCPDGDVDWYAVTIPAGQNLLDVSASYAGSFTHVDLELHLFGGSPSSDISSDYLTDTVLHDGKSAISSTVKVDPGNDFISVQGSGNDEEDTLNTYVLTVATAADPDTHEPNDTVATARAADASPGYFSYAGDLDLFAIDTTASNAIIHIQLQNGAGAKAVLVSQVRRADGTVIAEDRLNPGAALDARRPTPAPGTYYVALQQEAHRKPDRSTGASYTVALTAVSDPDLNEQSGRNDTPATAHDFGTVSSGSSLSPPSPPFIGTSGDQDFYSFTITGTAAAVLEIKAVAGSGSNIFPQIDLLTPDLASACTQDSDCSALNKPCSMDSDCELSHACLPPSTYPFCGGGQACRLCAAASSGSNAGRCVASGGGHYCAALQYTNANQYTPTAPFANVHTGWTAQPLLQAGTYYVDVHDFQDARFDIAIPYTLILAIASELDTADQSQGFSDPVARDNSYNPYPLADTNNGQNIARAKAVLVSDLKTVGIAGHISYASDEDWYEIPYPCDNATSANTACELKWNFTQTAGVGMGSAGSEISFALFGPDGSQYQGWKSAAASTTYPIDDTSCDQCSAAMFDYWNPDQATKLPGSLFLQVRDFADAHWGYAYSLSLQAAPLATNHCPVGCQGGSNPPVSFTPTSPYGGAKGSSTGVIDGNHSQCGSSCHNCCQGTGGP